MSFPTRRVARQVRVGEVLIGGGAPIVVQSMTNTDTADVQATVRQVEALARAGSELVRVTVNTPEAAAQAPPAAGVHRIVLRCEEEAWIEVKDGLDRLLVSSLNPAGTERVVRGRPPFTLVIGNAQHVRVTYDDRPIDLQPHTRVEVARFTLQ